MNTPHHTWSDSPIHEQIRTMSTDTPETFKSVMWSELGWTVDIDFARKLERERDEARELLAELRASVLDLSHPNIKMILSERDEAREYADKLAEGLPEGMLPKDVEVLREANLNLATELTAVTEQRDDWKAKYIQQNKDLGHELRDPNGTIWGECKRLQTELTAVTKQRDEALEKIATMVLAGDYNDLFIAKVTGNLAARAELTAVTEQRDKLAEALRKCREDSVCYQERMEVLGYVHAAKESKANSDRADAALQSLTPNAKP